jgi:hypothetical protein
MRKQSELAIQLFLAAQAIFGKLTINADATPKLIAVHTIIIQVTTFKHATQRISAFIVTFERKKKGK